MPIIELIPLNKGNRVILDDTRTVTTIGRTPEIGCLNNKISRNHAQLFVKSDGTLWIKPIHHNPTFYRTKTNQIVTLTRDKEYQLNDNDQFGLLPDEYFYRVSIKLKGEEIEKNSHPTQTTHPSKSTIPKSPIKDTGILIIQKYGEESMSPSSSMSNETRPLSTCIPDNSVTISQSNVEQNQESTNPASLVKEQACKYHYFL